MDISKIDKNFVQTDARGEKLVRYSIPCAPFALYGVYYDKKNARFARMSADVADRLNLSYLASCSAGGRLRFSTNSAELAIDVHYDGGGAMPHMPLTGIGGFTLLEEGAGENVWLATFRPENGNFEDFSASRKLIDDGAVHNYVLYFPLYASVGSLTVWLQEGSIVGGGKRYEDKKPILYYGSSITQGGCASRADNAYQAYIEEWTNVDFINLGFSGGARAEPLMVDYLASLDCSVFVCDYDHNAPDAQFLAETHYPLYERYRAVKKEVPILFISKPDRRGKAEAERAKIIRATYLRARAQGDENVYFLDGRRLFGRKDWMHCTVDGTHPNDLGFYRMAKAIYQTLKKIL